MDILNKTNNCNTIITSIFVYSSQPDWQHWHVRACKVGIVDVVNKAQNVHDTSFFQASCMAIKVCNYGNLDPNYKFL